MVIVLIIKILVVMKKKNTWDKILKVVIAVVSAILGALGGDVLNV